MRLLLRLESGQNDRAIRYILFWQSPKTITRFRRGFDALPPEIQEIARRNLALLKENQRHPSLHFKKIGNFRSVRIGRGHRAFAVGDEDGLTWVWIGTHKEYERVPRRH
uniref:ParE-like toxin domain-containing protein n=1 Tax=Candidatus Kentrum sp. FM TaxID=2126340 RepID=A0A450WCB2_9GAMM|nr:MAG: hypothetical protein BECKFM1743C_GA0114222_101265 [Candidatus Kentron sp. FM]VFJ53690.1 MAG: hypothetical protein BECKFM1743A_GA0114220_101183 [Candidatus Kentron sp. FM]VFK14635.1 MAG: hypothetical protein BECKFM1743B_GA0114221_103323 [Candidatus Kentron sp. FM]